MIWVRPSHYIARHAGLKSAPRSMQTKLYSSDDYAISRISPLINYWSAIISFAHLFYCLPSEKGWIPTAE